MFYNITVVFMSFILKMVCKLEVYGLENMPRNGQVVVVANHKSFWDPIVLGCVIKRKIYMMAKEELFKVPIFKNIIHALGAFPVKRGSPDRKALKLAAKILEEGNVLGLFPEGTRSKTEELLPAQPGAALIAIRSKAPIIPVGLKGTNLIIKSFRPTLIVNIGEILVYPNLYEGKVLSEDLEKISIDMMDAIKKLIND